VVNDEPLTRSKQLGRYHEGAQRVVARAAAGIANDVRIAFAKTGQLGRIDTGIHASEDGEAPRGRKRQLALVSPRPNSTLLLP